MKRLLFWCSFFLSFVIVTANAATPQLRVNSDKSPVKLVSVVVHTDITGSIAETTVEMKFRNNGNRTLEGELLFPLAPAQQIVGFSLDISGQQREAVAVGKARGRAAMDNIVRRGVDPGLIEKTAGNNFRLRVYPLFPRQTRTVVLRYTETLTQQKGLWHYRFPLDYEHKLEHFALTATVKHQDQPIIKSDTPIKIERVGNLYRAQVIQTNYQPSGWMDIFVPIEYQPTLYTETIANQIYFYAEIPAASYKPVFRQPVENATILWDSSASMQDSLSHNLALLDLYFKSMKNVRVNLVRLRNKAEKPISFTVKNGNWSELKQELTQTVYDGATNLADWSFSEKSQDYLLFTDGLNNWSKNPIARKDPRSSGNFYIISASNQINASWLRYHAEKNKGRWIDLKKENINTASDQLLKQDALLLVADRENAAQNIIIESRYPINNRFRVSGILPQSVKTLIFEVGYPDKEIKSVSLSTQNPTNQSGIARLWGQMAIQWLEGDSARHHDQISAISQQFNLVTSTTSLIVLEELRDYAQNRIPLPASMAQYQKQYDDLLERTERYEQEREKRHMPAMIAAFEARVKWWETDFPKGEVKKPAQSLKPAAPSQERAVEQRQRVYAAPVEEQAASPVMAGLVSLAPDHQSASASTVADTAGKEAAKDKVPSSVISVKTSAWTPDEPYLKKMAGLLPEEMYQIYLKERPNYAKSPAFYLDVAKMLLEANADRNLVVRVLSNLVEIELDNRHILRVLAYRLTEMGEAAQAVPFLETVLEMAPDEPQSLRDLGLAYQASAQHQKAIDTLYLLVKQPWDNRFGDIGLISLAELNAIVATSQQPLKTSPFEPKLIKNLPVDIRVVLGWDSDNTDIDLEITDPNNERVYYGNPLSYQGGRVSRDVTQGYGPEEFILRQAKPGKYKVTARYFSNRQQIVTGAVTLQMTLQMHFGTEKQTQKIVTLRLTNPKENIIVGEFTVD